ncbi:MAG: hypothetical protein AB7F23_06710 [Phycisphaerae bacterium]
MRFLVYSNGALASEFDLNGAYVFDADRTVLGISDSIAFADGRISFDLLNYETAGLSVLWNVDGIGRLQLSTAKLRRRQEPYILNLELARAKLMQITLKREDWELFDEQDDHTHKVISAAVKLFVEALANVRSPAKASEYADKCLKKAILAAENLAQRQAQYVIEEKAQRNELNELSNACVLQPKYTNSPSYIKNISAIFDRIVIPVHWVDIEKKKGTYDFSALDQYIAAFNGTKVKFTAGPLLRFENGFFPSWLADYEFDGVKELAYNFVSEAVKRYAGVIDSWVLVGGMNSRNDLKFAFDDCIDICAAACMAAKTAHSSTTRILSLDKPWGWYHGENVRTIPTEQFAETLVQNAISFDKLGLEIDFSGLDPDNHARDLMQISAMLDRFSMSLRPLCIMSVKVPSAQNKGGYWRALWSDNTQAAFVKALYKILFGKHQIDMVAYGCFIDPETPVGLVSQAGEPKKALKFIKNAKILSAQ